MSCLLNVLFNKCPFYEMSCLRNVLSMKCPIYEMSSLWYVLSIKCRVFKMSCQWNVLCMKCPIYEMSCLWNVLSMKCPFYEMFYDFIIYEMSICDVFLKNVPTPFLYLSLFSISMMIKNHFNKSSKLIFFDNNKSIILFYWYKV